MPYKCCVPLCRGNYNAKNRVHVFRFPTDEKMKSAWLRSICRKDFEVTKHSRICQKHFQASDIEWSQYVIDCKKGIMYHVISKKPKLNKDAVPSIFPGYPDYLLKKESKEELAANSLQMQTMAEEEVSDSLHSKSADPPFLLKENSERKSSEKRLRKKALAVEQAVSESLQSKADNPPDLLKKNSTRKSSAKPLRKKALAEEQAVSESLQCEAVNPLDLLKESKRKSLAAKRKRRQTLAVEQAVSEKSLSKATDYDKSRTFTSIEELKNCLAFHYPSTNWNIIIKDDKVIFLNFEMTDCKLMFNFSVIVQNDMNLILFCKEDILTSFGHYEFPVSVSNINEVFNILEYIEKNAACQNEKLTVIVAKTKKRKAKRK